MARNYARDYKELPLFADKRKGATVIEVIEEYAQKRKVVSHRIGATFWDLANEGIIKTIKGNDGIERIQ